VIIGSAAQSVLETCPVRSRDEADRAVGSFGLVALGRVDGEALKAIAREIRGEALSRSHSFEHVSGFAF